MRHSEIYSLIINTVSTMNRVFYLFFFCIAFTACESEVEKPRILISTDIGGTDPDDFQSMIHFLMYSDLFETEGLVSSPSFGHGKKQDILDMIDLYEKDLPKLRTLTKDFPSPDALRAICKQGRSGAAPFEGYATSTEGSDWIVECAKRESNRPLWVLVWGGLEDLAQALHDAPEIQNAIRVYWIGGPNKKWSANSYAYIAEYFPDLWMIEANASYRGFFPNKGVPDSLSTDNYYDNYIVEAGYLGKEFKKHYGGKVKMGDTPSLLYMMHGDPNDPMGESWGGSFEKMTDSPRYVFDSATTLADTVSAYSVAEFHIEGPQMNIPTDSACFTMVVYAGIGEQKWDGYYRGEGKYAVRYAFKQAETLTYKITSDIEGFPELEGQLVVDNTWPSNKTEYSYVLGNNWYTDRADIKLFAGMWQGGETILKWRSNVLLDWAKRWNTLR